MTNNRSEGIAGIAAALGNSLQRWRSLGDRPSDGEVMCAGCWDRSEYDTSADHDIPKGMPVFWSNPHPECGDTDAYCLSCAAEDAHAYEIISDREVEAIRTRLNITGTGEPKS